MAIGRTLIVREMPLLLQSEGEGHAARCASRALIAEFLTEVPGLFKIDWQADVAQLVEQSIRNRQVIGSSPIVGSSKFLSICNMPALSGGLCF